MVRHIRDPVTGRCMVCDQTHGPNQVMTGNKGPSSWDNVRKKIIYMNAFNPQRSPSPTRSRAPSPTRQQHGPDVVYVNGHYPHGHPPTHHQYPQDRRSRDYDNDSGASQPSARSTSKVHLIGAAGAGYMGGQYADDPYRGRSPDRYPRQQGGRERTPSPSGTGCCGKTARSTGQRNYGYYKDGKAHGYPGKGRGIGAAHHRSTVYNGQANNWGRRRCCACLLGFLLLALLAGLIVGLYYGIKAAETNAEENSPENRYPGGYYVNGVYVMPVTESPPQTYLVFGLDTPCNPYNNNTASSNNDTMPNCEDVTTRLVASNYTPPTPAPVMVVETTAASASALQSQPLLFLLLLVASVYLPSACKIFKTC